MPTIHGECYCGGVGFSVTLDDDPERAAAQVTYPGYCHCFDCKRAHAASIADGAFVADEAFAFTRGEDLVRDYRRGGGPVRSFCTVCGTRVTNRLPGSSAGVCVFYALLDPDTQRDLPEALRPRVVFHRGSETLHREVLLGSSG